MTNILHGAIQIADGVHCLQGLGPYTNEAARLTAGSLLATTDIGRVGIQSDTGQYWMLIAVGVWQRLSGPRVPKTDSTTARTFALSDADVYWRFSNAAAIAGTIPPNATVAFPIGTELQAMQAGAGQFTWTPGAGVTFGPGTAFGTKALGSRVLAIKIGTDTWDIIGDLAASAGTFAGDFGALFASYSGLTVRAYFRSDLGVTGTTGTGKSSWANQAGDSSAMTPISGATNGIGTPTTGLNGHAGLATDGSTQDGLYTFTGSAVAPATTNQHVWAIDRILVTPGGTNGCLHIDSGSAGSIIFSGQTSPAANVTLYDAGAGPVTTGVVTNQWYRVRQSFTGSASDVIRVGAHAPAAAATSNGAPGLIKGWCAASAGGGQKLSAETLCIVHVDGPLATFLTACASADTNAQLFWTSAIEI